MINALVGGLFLVLGGADDGASRPGAETYEARKATAGRDARSQVELALWCEAQGLDREKIRHLSVAVLTDPSHAMARALLGLVEYRGKWQRPEAVADSVKVDVAAADLLAEYNGRRVAAPLKVDAQMKLAAWCTEKGLTAEAHAHYATVVRLDSNHAEAWKRLGYKKTGGRWVTDAIADAEKADREAQSAADKAWQPRLTKLREELGKPQTRERAEAELATVADPRAVPTVWKVFVTKGEAHHRSAVQLLGQIDAQASSRALATLALFAPRDGDRRAATETLRRRDPREWADLPIGLIRAKIKYEVKPVGGPGSPGVLFVEGKQANLKRLYTPDAGYQPAPGDRLRYDLQGRLVAVRKAGPSQTTRRVDINEIADDLFSTGGFDPNNYLIGGEVGYQRNIGGSPYQHVNVGRGSESAVKERIGQVLGPSMGRAASDRVVAGLEGAFSAPGRDRSVGRGLAQPFNKTGEPYGFVFEVAPTVAIPVEQMAADAARSAVAAQEQLKRDVAALDAHNVEVARSNERPVGVLSAATGGSFAEDRLAWEKWYVNQVGYAFVTSNDSRPTIVENVPFASQPTAVLQSGYEVLSSMRVSCFGKGTLVRTIDGPRPIETLSIGDKVLTQDTRTGKLGYRPILVVHRNPPSPTFRVAIDGRPVVASHFHRFWKAGQGWVMARDLKVGDPIRTLDGVAKVTAVEADKVQPVFNLDVADDADFFAGPVAALVHDNTLPDLRLAPFDAPAAVARR